MKDEFIADAYCGLYCASCPSYMATQTGTAGEKGLTECKGCKSGHLMGEWCSSCNLKSCAREKGVNFCHECSEYPCVNLVQFKEDKNFPYHSEVFDYQSLIDEKGKAAWLAEMGNRWKCSECDTSFNWWALNCSHCGKPVNGYQRPE